MPLKNPPKGAIKPRISDRAVYRDRYLGATVGISGSIGVRVNHARGGDRMERRQHSVRRIKANASFLYAECTIEVGKRSAGRLECAGQLGSGEGPAEPNGAGGPDIEPGPVAAAAHSDVLSHGGGNVEGQRDLGSPSSRARLGRGFDKCSEG
jgi:hypothetical protein